MVSGQSCKYMYLYVRLLAAKLQIAVSVVSHVFSCLQLQLCWHLMSHISPLFMTTLGCPIHWLHIMPIHHLHNTCFSSWHTVSLTQSHVRSCGTLLRALEVIQSLLPADTIQNTYPMSLALNFSCKAGCSMLWHPNQPQIRQVACQMSCIDTTGQDRSDCPTHWPYHASYNPWL